jgi:hypothetical protein
LAVLVSSTTTVFCAAKLVADELQFAGHLPETDLLETKMSQLLRRVRSGEATLNLAEYAEYALMLAIVLTITLLTAAMIGRNSHHVISEISKQLS